MSVKNECTFCKCLILLAKDKYKGIQLVEEYYDEFGVFKGQTRYGSYDLNYCPQCGRKIIIKRKGVEYAE